MEEKMKTAKNKLARIAAAAILPAAATISGCGTVKGLTHDIGYISTKISDSIDLDEKPKVTANPNSYRYKNKNTYQK